MKRISWLLVVPLALVSALSVPAGCVEFDSYNVRDGGAASGGAGGVGGMSTSTGGTGGAGGSAGTGGAMGTPCGSTADCVALENECQSTGQCVSGMCKWTLVAADTPLSMPSQVYGDCNQVVCDGNGGIDMTHVDMADKYTWSNPCYAPSCGTDTLLASLGPCVSKWGQGGTCQADFSCIECSVDAGCSGATPSCQGGRCVPFHCTSGMLDAANGETDQDCGGPCAPCGAGQSCSQKTDCAGDGKCTGGKCFAPSCSDGTKNGDETGVDCGGACASDPMTPIKCAVNIGCLFPSDCQSGLCMAGTCK